ncbi:uncharacterized protein LOC131251903 [Magnolia sinica]|uniref:uncharacterized protein LOC131251903 n=1 Tax=Magnolia sinica TaxID=86752 RepID=UPI0026583F46|nr:uncharacterized protein LOC131251903 [Magnolia sinica]
MCRGLGITNAYSSPQHSQSNGQVEAVNKVIKHHLKIKLEKVKGNWAEELPFVLWANRITAQSFSRETPFSLSYSLEAMVPVKIGIPMAWVKNYQENQNDEQIAANLDLLERPRKSPDSEPPLDINRWHDSTILKLRRGDFV